MNLGSTEGETGERRDSTACLRCSLKFWTKPIFFYLYETLKNIMTALV